MKHFTNKLVGLTSIICAMVSINSCSPPKEVEKKLFLTKTVVNNEDTIAGAPKFQGDAHGGVYFTHTDKENMYGVGTTFNIPDSLLRKSIRVNANFWVRQGDLNEKNQLAISLEDLSGNIVQWSSVELKNHVTEAGKWINVIDSVTFQENLINKSGLIIKIFPFNPEGTSFMDIDDNEISVFKVDKVVVE